MKLGKRKVKNNVRNYESLHGRRKWNCLEKETTQKSSSVMEKRNNKEQREKKKMWL